jgi:hypothetical protein
MMNAAITAVSKEPDSASATPAVPFVAMPCVAPAVELAALPMLEPATAPMAEARAAVKIRRLVIGLLIIDRVGPVIRPPVIGDFDLGPMATKIMMAKVPDDAVAAGAAIIADRPVPGGVMMVMPPMGRMRERRSGRKKGRGEGGDRVKLHESLLKTASRNREAEG